MVSNYRTHLFVELRELETAARPLTANSAKLEVVWQQAKQRRVEYEAELAALKLDELGKQEAFRSSHKKLTQLRQAIGEIQDELFASGEEEEDHYHQ